MRRLPGVLPVQSIRREQCQTRDCQIDKRRDDAYPGSCITCGACNQVCPTQANPFDLINERQEQIGALGIPNEAFERFAKLHDLPVKIEMGDPGRPVLNLCIVGAMVREQIQGPLFKGLTIVEGADYFCGVGYIHLGKPSMTAGQGSALHR